MLNQFRGDGAPVAGEVRINPQARVALVNQHHADQLNLSLSPLAFMRRRFPGDGSYDHDQRLRSHLVRDWLPSCLKGGSDG